MSDSRIKDHRGSHLVTTLTLTRHQISQDHPRKFAQSQQSRASPLEATKSGSVGLLCLSIAVVTRWAACCSPGTFFRTW